MRVVAWVVRGALVFTVLALAAIMLRPSFVTGAAQHVAPPAVTCAAGSTPAQCRAPAPVAAGTPEVPWAQGMPAVRPESALSHNTGATAAPTFTEADVCAWIASRPLGRQVSNSPTPTITSFSFLTTEEVSAKLEGEDVGSAPGALLCYVTVHGSFVSYQALAGSPPVNFTDGYLVLDAHTGNLILSNLF